MFGSFVMSTVVCLLFENTALYRLLSCMFIQGGHRVWKTERESPKYIPCREKSGNLKIWQKSGNYQGILQNLRS